MTLITLNTLSIIQLNNNISNACHNYLRWRGPGKLKSKISDSEIHLDRMQTLSSEKIYYQIDDKHEYLSFKVISWSEFVKVEVSIYKT